MRPRSGRGSSADFGLKHRGLGVAALLGAVFAGAWAISFSPSQAVQPVAIASVIPAPPSPPPITEDLRALRAELSRIIPEWRGSRWSVLAISLDRGDTLFNQGARNPLAPASNMKLVTTAAALHYLGPRFRYQTFLLADGPVVEGRLQGDLILYGTGDPGISSRFYRTNTVVFEMLVDQLIARGITTVDGKVMGDGTFFRGPELGPGWNPRDLNDWFAAPVSGLSFNENTVNLQVEAGATVGARPIVRVLPDPGVFLMDNFARTVDTRPRPMLWIDRERPGEAIRIGGEMPLTGRDLWREMPISNPSLFAASALARVMEKKGVHITRTPQPVTPGGSRVTGRHVWGSRAGSPAPRVVARHTSPALFDYLTVVNKQSQNFLAETVLKTMGRVVVGDGSFAGGSRVVESFLEKQAGVAMDGIEVADGSGLSEGNRVSAAALVGVLEYMSGTDLWDTFLETLPEAGRRGELPRMFRTPAARNLRAKTGTMDGVSALSGMVRSEDGERILFSIVANGVPESATKRVEDRFGARLAGFRRARP
ncbi:MAG: D-alanyl-D-alanine carboxypeptidase/D-alanyl-D-alanine-endopeptidase [Gemmatimonadota bacterium]|nr:MAG: D-alanyl-D-alanine carboxypeptidase/D-alanyl-D-alanine-endopeptidase [Gemmatimonadota bacterium]